MKSSFRRQIIPSLAILAIVAACGADTVLQPDDSPLAGLDKSASGDTANVTHSPTGTGPGYFRGTVLGPSQPGAGNDSLNTAPKISGVVVTIYERKAGTGDTVAVGDAKGSVTTGTDGKFQLPTLPAGEYVVTFVPPAGSPYHGAYAFGPLRQNSSDYPWWVVLAKK
jgi:hypothetical protein